MNTKPNKLELPSLTNRGTHRARQKPKEVATCRFLGTSFQRLGVIPTAFGKAGLSLFSFVRPNPDSIGIPTLFS